MNIQQIPKNSLPKDRQKDYRSCFIPGYEDWVMVDADYSSAELAILATLSGDEVFLDALSTGKDLHSVVSETALKEKWHNASSEISKIYPKKKDGTIDVEYKCEYYQLGENGLPKNQKCNCPLHQKMRQNMKSATFGLAYGLSPKGLAADLYLELSEAEELFDDYFRAFPKIKGTLDAFSNFGKMNGFIRTIAPFRRKRYFPYWKGEDTPKGLMGQISRASMNSPIQGANADFCKIALIMLRKWINKNDLRNKVRLYLQLHDEITLTCHRDISELVLSKTIECMETAATLVLKNTLLKVDAEISETW